MTRPTEEVRLDPLVVRDQATRLAAQGQDLWKARGILLDIDMRDESFEVDELVQAFRRFYDPRREQADERAAAVAKEFEWLGATGTEVANVYERVDAEAATNLAREHGLLPPR